MTNGASRSTTAWFLPVALAGIGVLAMALIVCLCLNAHAVNKLFPG